MTNTHEKNRFYTYIVQINKNSLVFHESPTGGFWAGEMTIRGSHNLRRFTMGHKQKMAYDSLNLTEKSNLEVWGPYAAKGGVFRIRTIQFPKEN